MIVDISIIGWIIFRELIIIRWRVMRRIIIVVFIVTWLIFRALVIGQWKNARIVMGRYSITLTVITSIR